MRATCIRMISGKRLSLHSFNKLRLELQRQFAKAGFETNIYMISSCSIKIGLHMKSFTIDPNILGYNAKVGRYVNSPKGYKRTTTPLWEQREDFNHIVNDAFDKFGLQANIKSGYYKVRTVKGGRIDEWACVDFHGNPAEPDVSYNGMGEELDRLMTEKEAREYCDSDRLEAEARIKRLELQRERRQAIKAPTLRLVEVAI